MNFTRAQIVRSLAGHDKGAFFCVLDTEGDFLLLADGKHRRVEAHRLTVAISVECCAVVMGDFISDPSSLLCINDQNQSSWMKPFRHPREIILLV